MSGMESGPHSVESAGSDKNFEYLQTTEPQLSSEGTYRGLGHTALEAAGVHEPVEREVSSEVYQMLGQTAVKNS